jgi:hypothetical protein
MLHRHLAHLPTVQLLHFDTLDVPNALNATLSRQIFRQWLDGAQIALANWHPSVP